MFSRLGQFDLQSIDLRLKLPGQIVLTLHLRPLLLLYQLDDLQLHADRMILGIDVHIVPMQCRHVGCVPTSAADVPSRGGLRR